MNEARSFALVAAFNACINARNLPRLAELMSEDHVFVDSAGAVVSGKQACLAAWAAFFAAFPDYRDVFDDICASGDDIVITGRSECSDARLVGPALWSAKLEGGRIAAWRVWTDTANNCAGLGIGPALSTPSSNCS